MENTMDKFLAFIGGVVLVVGAVFVLAVIMALPTMLLWNFVIPAVTKEAFAPIGLWQALCLNFLCGILFKSNSTCKCKKEE
jgi:hypothetical protein